MKTCNFCSFENPDSGRFCSGCGKPLTKEAEDQVLQKEAPSPTIKQGPKKHRWFVWVFAAIVTVIVVFLFMMWPTGYM